MSVARTERGLDRLVNFSDATVAIAITLLILPLVDEASKAFQEGFGAWLSANYPQLVAFALSFVVIARFWITHHQLFECVAGYDLRIIWLNFVWLAAIVAMPFTTSALSSDDHEPSVVYGIYIGNMLLASVMLYLIASIVRRTPALLSEGGAEELASTHGWLSTVILLVALVIAVLLPRIGMWSLLLLFLQRPIGALLDRRRRTR